MHYTNSMKITMKNEETASIALEIMKARLTAGFDYDKEYGRSPSSHMYNGLELVGNDIILPEDRGYYSPNDSLEIIPELIQHLAEHLATEEFAFHFFGCSCYDESWVDGSCVSGQLKIRTTYLPYGFGSFTCLECGECIAYMEDDEEGNITIKGKADICPECGEEVKEHDWSEWLPIVDEKTIKVI